MVFVTGTGGPGAGGGQRTCDAFKRYGYTQSNIATFLELDRMTVSKTIIKTN